MFFSFVKQFFFREIQEIKYSWYKLSLLFFIPLISFTMIICIFYKAIVTNLPIVVVDNDYSTASRDLIFSINATQALDVRYKVTSVKEAKNLLSSSKAYAIVVIPYAFSKKIYRHELPQVTLFINAEYILIGKVISSALSGVLLAKNIAFNIGAFIAKEQNLQIAVVDLNSIKFSIIQLFNENQNYFYFLVLAILFSMWQIFIAVCVIVVFGEMVKTDQYKKILQKFTFAKLVGILLPYTIVFFLWGMLIVFFMYGVYGWDFNGNIFTVIFALFLTIIAYEAIALLFIFIGKDYARALSLTAVYTAPAFAFLGITFPQISMNSFASFWSNMLPVKYLIDVVLLEANYAANYEIVLQDIQALLYFSLVFIFSLGVIYKRVYK